MDEKLARQVEELKKAMGEDPRFQELNEADSLLRKDPEALSLEGEKEKAEEAFNEALRHYGEKSSEAVEARKVLYRAKLALDECPAAKRYYAAYVPVRDLLAQIDDMLFGEFREKRGC